MPDTGIVKIGDNSDIRPLVNIDGTVISDPEKISCLLLQEKSVLWEPLINTDLTCFFLIYVRFIRMHTLAEHQPLKQPTPSSITAVTEVARHYGVEVPAVCPLPDRNGHHSAQALGAWALEAGLWSKAVRLKWRQLKSLNGTGPVILLMKDGSAAVMLGYHNESNSVILREPGSTIPQPVDQMRLEQNWEGEVLLLRAKRAGNAEEQPFTAGFLMRMVAREGRAMTDIAIASVTLSFLTVFPPLLVMNVVDKVLTHRSSSTLILLALFMLLGAAYEMFIGGARRVIVLVTGARLDARLNLHVFNKLLGLPLDYFEQHPSGETMYRVSQVYKIRDFITGKLMTTVLDMFTLVVVLPILFYLNATLSWMVLGCGMLMMLIITSFLPALRRRFKTVVDAETEKSSVLSESIFGIRTLKSLALEPQKREQWDLRVAETGRARLRFGLLSNWPQTLITPLERFMGTGIILIGAWMALSDPSGYMVGSLFAFMMLSGRVAQPLGGMARLIEDYEEIRSSIGQAASVLNRTPEVASGAEGLRPEFQGGISFQDVRFVYAGSRTPALDGVSFTVPPGTMLGVVGRSGSGKSTLTRLLQGISRDYTGFIKLDGVELRDINLRHLRSGQGIVLQDNFLFRGSVRDNVLAGRAGLTFSDAVNAVRLAGAEEFVELLPNGYDTFIQEGSPNLSGGQRQRLAIARAVITDPKLMILDEATSALDPESEARVNANLLRIARGRTMVVVSHRLSSLVDCNLILVLDAGGVVDMAPHNVLLERCTIYRNLWNRQNRKSSTNPLSPGLGVAYAANGTGIIPVASRPRAGGAL